MSERLTSISISTASAPTIRLSAPSTMPSVGGRAFSPNFLSHTQVLARPAPKPDFLKMPKVEVVKAPSSDQRISQAEAFNPNNKILWQAPKPEIGGQKPESKPSVSTFKAEKTPAAQPSKEQPKAVEAKPKPPVQPEKPKAEAPKIETKDITKPKVVTRREEAKTQPLAQTLAQELAPGVQKPDFKRLERAVKATEKPVSVLKQEVEEVAKAINVPKPKEQPEAKPLQLPISPALKPETQRATQTQPELSPDLKQALKTYELLAAALIKTQVAPEAAQKQAAIIVSQAIRPELKEQFLTSLQQKPEAKERQQEAKERDEIIRFYIERDPETDNRRVKAAIQALIENFQPGEILSGTKVADRITSNLLSKEQLSPIIRPIHPFDGLLEDFQTFIRRSEFRTLEEGYQRIDLASKLFPAARFNTQVTTEGLHREKAYRIYYGNIDYVWVDGWGVCRFEPAAESREKPNLFGTLHKD